MKYSAIVLAGSRPGIDPFAKQFGKDIKALVGVGGEPMVRRPVRALLASSSISQVVVLGQSPERIANVIPANPRLAIGRSAETIAETMLKICRDPETRWPILVTTADHALLDPAMIDEFVSGAGGADLAIGVVERRRMIGRFPGAQRTWLHFRGGAYTGANLFALASPKAAPLVELWRSVEQQRKKGWRVVALAGPVLLMGTLLRLLSIDGMLARLGRRLHLKIKAVTLSNPLAGIDVDKPSDHTLVEAILAGKA